MILPLTFYANYTIFFLTQLLVFFIVLSVFILFIALTYYSLNSDKYYLYFKRILVVFFYLTPLIIFPIMYMISNTLYCKGIKDIYITDNISCYSGSHLILVIISILILAIFGIFMYIHTTFLLNFNLYNSTNETCLNQNYFYYTKLFKSSISFLRIDLMLLLGIHVFIIKSAIFVLCLAFYLYNSLNLNFSTYKKNSHCELKYRIILFFSFLTLISNAFWIFHFEKFNFYFECLLIVFFFNVGFNMKKYDFDDFENLNINKNGVQTFEDALKILICFKNLIKSDLKDYKMDILMNYIYDYNKNSIQIKRIKNMIDLENNNNANDEKNENLENSNYLSIDINYRASNDEKITNYFKKQQDEEENINIIYNKKFFKIKDKLQKYLYLHLDEMFEYLSNTLNDDFQIKFFHAEFIFEEFSNYQKALRMISEMENKACTNTEIFMIYYLKDKILTFKQNIQMSLELSFNPYKNIEDVKNSLRLEEISSELKIKISTTVESLIDYWNCYRTKQDFDFIKKKGFEIFYTIENIITLFNSLVAINLVNEELSFMYSAFISTVLDEKVLAKDIKEKYSTIMDVSNIKLDLNSLFNSGLPVAIANYKNEILGAEVIKSSHQFAKIFGCIKSDIEGKSVNNLIPDIFANLHNEIIKKYSEHENVENENNRKTIVGFGIDKSGYIFKIHTNITRVPSFKYNQLYIVRLHELEKINSDYKGYIITDLLLNAKYISSEIPMIFGLNEREISNMKYSNEYDFLSRFNVSDFFTDLKFTDKEIISCKSNNDNTNLSDIESLKKNCQNIVNKKIEEFKKSKKSITQFYIGNHSIKSNCLSNILSVKNNISNIFSTTDLCKFFIYFKSNKQTI